MHSLPHVLYPSEGETEIGNSTRDSCTWEIALQTREDNSDDGMKLEQMLQFLSGVGHT